MGWVSSGLQDFSLSRAKVEWGIPVPWDASQTVYVWVDALHGYLSGAPRLRGPALLPRVPPSAFAGLCSAAGGR